MEAASLVLPVVRAEPRTGGSAGGSAKSISRQETGLSRNLNASIREPIKEELIGLRRGIQEEGGEGKGEEKGGIAGSVVLALNKIVSRITHGIDLAIKEGSISSEEISGVFGPDNGELNVTEGNKDAVLSFLESQLGLSGLEEENDDQFSLLQNRIATLDEMVDSLDHAQRAMLEEARAIDRANNEELRTMNTDLA